jgi:hypothetical protein
VSLARAAVQHDAALRVQRTERCQQDVHSSGPPRRPPRLRRGGRSSRLHGRPGPNRPGR